MATNWPGEACRGRGAGSVLAAEAHLTTARAGAEDPAVASDAAALERRLAELKAAQLEADRLYERWAELEAKQR